MAKGGALALLGFAAVASACDRQPAGAVDAGAVANETPTETGHAGAADAEPDADEATAHIDRWDKALKTAQSIPCRAIAVDGPVRAETVPDAGAPLDAVALRGELPDDAWLVLGISGRLVAKDPRTTRETAFVGPARIRPCVAHREESWIAAGRFESAMGAGETPGAEEWVVTPLAVARYMAAEVHVDVRPPGVAVELGTGAAFLWLADDVRESAAPHPASDAGALATTAVDDDGWRRMTSGALALSWAGGAPPAPVAGARGAVARCVALTERARDLAAELLAGLATRDAGTAKDQLRTRRIARAACSIATLRVGELPPTVAKSDLSARLEGVRGTMGLPVPAPSAPPAP